MKVNYWNHFGFLEAIRVLIVSDLKIGQQETSKKWIIQTMEPILLIGERII